MGRHIYRQPPAAGSSIDQQRNATFARQGAKCGEVLHGAEIMIGVVRGDEAESAQV